MISLISIAKESKAFPYEVNITSKHIASMLDYQHVEVHLFMTFMSYRFIT
jgi:hypothetical protein